MSPDYNSSVHGFKPDHPRISPRQHRGPDPPRARSGGHHVARADGGKRLLGAVPHQDRRVAGQAPGLVTLRPTKPLRLVARQQERDRPIRPDEPRLRHLIIGIEPRLGDLHDAGRSVQHDRPDRLGGRGGHDELGLRRERLRAMLDPLGPRFGLPCAATRLIIPYNEIFWRPLGRPGPLVDRAGAVLLAALRGAAAVGAVPVVLGGLDRHLGAAAALALGPQDQEVVAHPRLLCLAISSSSSSVVSLVTSTLSWRDAFGL
jgi:antitoxin (DNA-binding transcriptional repressor) of toxin-antitoxin stability system